MDLIIYRRTTKDGQRKYLVLVAEAEWGSVPITYDTKVIMQILPSGVNHREITEKGVPIGVIN